MPQNCNSKATHSTAQHSTSSHVESQEAGTVRPHPLRSALCTCLQLHSALPLTCNVSSSVLSFVHLCSPIRHNPPRETLSTLVSKGGKRRSGERWRKQGLVASHASAPQLQRPCRQQRCFRTPAKPGSLVCFRTGGAVSCCSCTPGST